MLVDGVPEFAVEEERLIREKRTRKFPYKGINEAFKLFKISIEDLDCIAIGWNPSINLETYNSSFSDGRSRFIGEYFYSVANNLLRFTGDVGDISEQIIQLKSGKKINIFFVRHHLAHASSFYSSGFKDSSILTIDAFGEKESVTFSLAKNNNISTIWKQEFPHSLGSFYSAFTSFLGFQPQNDEWKVMGASAYGDSKKFQKKIKETYKILEEGFQLDLSFFNHFQFHRPGLFTEKLSSLLNLSPNIQDKELTQEYYDLAAAVQKSFEEIYFSLINQLFKKNHSQNLVISGGSALNSLANGKVLENSNFKKIFIPPVPDDSGVSLGAAQYVYNKIYNGNKKYVMKNNYLGPKYTEERILKTLKTCKLNFKNIVNVEEHAAKNIVEGKIIGWFQGSLEFGDRALGNRSIIADPRDKLMKDKVNKLVKYREPFRPFAPAILYEELENYFVNPSPTPFMEKVLHVIESKKKLIPAVTHEDGTGRVQTVSIESNHKFYKLIYSFYKLTNIPILMNTSFNLKGEPIVCSPEDAIRTFFSSGLDLLYIENFCISK